MSAALSAIAETPVVDESAIGSALARWVPLARRVGPWRWRLPLGDPLLAGGRVDAAEGWLAFERPLTGRAAADGGWELLRAGSRLPHMLRVAHGLDGEPVVRADIAVDGATDWSRVCHDAIEALATAELALDAATEPASGPEPAADPAIVSTSEPALAPGPAGVRPAAAHSPLAPAPGADAAAARAATLVALCAESGHAAAARPSGAVVVDFGEAEAFRQAEIVAGAGGAVRIAVEIVTRAACTGPCRMALAALLLAASGAVRLARPWAEEREDALWAGFEVRLARAPDVETLGRALSALAAACHACAREAEALGDEAVAGEYIAARAAGRSTMAAPVHPGAPNGPGHDSPGTTEGEAE